MRDVVDIPAAGNTADQIVELIELVDGHVAGGMLVKKIHYLCSILAIAATMNALAAREEAGMVPSAEATR